ncbi:MAG: 50S ribosomal protein L10 [Proteobacteria bacterium]|nr:50S ribosomal protein L10 [Pseudomonadota bacterium]
MALTHKQAMARKTASLEELREKFGNAKIAILTDYRGEGDGLDVKDITALRGRLREQDGEYKVVKNTLARKVVGELGITGLDAHFENPTAIAFGYKDPVTLAKALTDFLKERKQKPPYIKAAYMDGQVLDAKGIDALASLPSREVIYQQLLGMLIAPHQQLMRLLQEPGRRVASITHQISEKQPEGAPAAAEA